MLWLALAGVALLATGCGKNETNQPSIRPALAFVIPAVGSSGGEMQVYSGEIRARIESDHAFRIGGKIAQRLIDTGATVKRGQALAVLDAQDVKLVADAARAQASALQTEAEFADAELRRFGELFSKGFVSQSALDQKRNAAQAARARLAAQQASADVSLNQSGYATLHAEMDGVVTQIMAEAGQVVAPGQVIVRIANPREKELVIAIPEARIGAFRIGLNKPGTARIHLWSDPEKIYPGSIREIAAAADPITRTFSARIALATADDRIGLGMTAYAAFGGIDPPGSFAVPLSSLTVRGNTTGVWHIAADGRVAFKPVHVVQYRETRALVRADASHPVKPGDRIVAAGVHKLREGEIVKPIVDPQIKVESKVSPAAEVPTAPAKLPMSERTAPKSAP